MEATKWGLTLLTAPNMQDFNLVRQLNYEDTEKTPYFYMARHKAWVRACRAQEGQLKVFGKDCLRWGGKCLYGLLWGFTRLVWGVAYIVEHLVDLCIKVLTLVKTRAKLSVYGKVISLSRRQKD